MLNMGSDAVTKILYVALAVAIVVLFSLVVAFLVIFIKNKKEEKKLKEKVKLETEQKNQTGANTIITKAYTTQNVKSFLDFDEIKDNMIIQDKGKRYVMIIQCKGINYDLMSSIEKVSVEQSFIQFLNSINSPIQLYMQSRKVNLEESINNYREKLKGIEMKYNKAKMQYEQISRNVNASDKQYKDAKFEYVRLKNLYNYSKDIIDNTERMSLNKNILTKNYYIAISHMPENSDNLFDKEEIMDMAFSELYTNAQSIIRILGSCGVTGRVLDSSELAELLYSAYNRDASEIYGVEKALKAGYDAIYTTAPDVFEKKIQELNKIIEERALDLANETLFEVETKQKSELEAERIERNMDDLIANMAKRMIEENEEYVGKRVTNEAKKEIDKRRTSVKTAKGA